MAIAAPRVAGHLFGPRPSLTVVLTALWSAMLALGVVMVLGMMTNDRQTRASALMAQVTYIRELSTWADETDGAANTGRIMGRVLTPAEDP